MIDINNTQIAFESKSNSELKASYRLFKMMNSPFLVNFGTKAALFALNLHLPIEGLVKKTLFRQFVGGATLEECEKTIMQLEKFQSLTILDYGAEAKESDEDFERTKNEFIKVLKFASNHKSVPVISIKVTGMARFELLEKVSAKAELTEAEKTEYETVKFRVGEVCKAASELKTAVFIDAEESWIQDAIDQIANSMMEKFNRQEVYVYNTYQLYRHDRLAYLRKSHRDAISKNYILGAKLVRGAYMEKERNRAVEKGYPSPIQPDKKATDHDFDEAVRYCVDNFESLASCLASHNAPSNLLQVELMQSHQISSTHPHLMFSQLYGMSDNLTFNLANAGFRVAKYVPYGPVRDVVPYLIRRAQENTSISGDMSRELSFIKLEIKRRGI